MALLPFNQARLVLVWSLISVQLIAPASSAPLSAESEVPLDQAAIKYSIVIDAGSSGCRLNIYKFLINDDILQVSEVQQVQASPHKVKPGLSTLADNPSGVDSYIQPLLDAAKEAIPEDKHSSTPIILGATAGMRLLSEEDADAVMNEVRSVFSDKDRCPFKFKPQFAQIITGEWEGIYGWITVNFLENVFATKDKVNTYGILDVGGASHQNSFKIRKNQHHVTLNLGGKVYNIFSRTYLGYGLEEALEKFKNFLVEGKDCSESQGCEVKSPCHFRGYEEKKNISGVDWKFVGTAQVKKCRSKIKEIYFCKNDSSKCPFHDQPQLKGNFFGMSNMYYVPNGIGMLESTDRVSARRLGKATKSFCKKSYDEVKDDPYAKRNCFGGNYMYELLRDGYNLSANKQIRVYTSLNGFDLGWTLGTALYNDKLL